MAPTILFSPQNEKKTRTPTKFSRDNLHARKHLEKLAVNWRTQNSS